MALISPTVVEQKYGIPVAQLRRWRAAGTGPEYFRLGPRSIAYYTPDLDDWLKHPARAHLRGAATSRLTGNDRRKAPGHRVDSTRAVSELGG